MTVALPAVTGPAIRAALERDGWYVRGEDPGNWAMKKGASFPLMVPKQDWPLAEKWVREIIADAGLTDSSFLKLVI